MKKFDIGYTCGSGDPPPSKNAKNVQFLPEKVLFKMARKRTKLSQMEVCYIPEFSRPIGPLTDVYRLWIEREIKKSFLGKL